MSRKLLESYLEFTKEMLSLDISDEINQFEELMKKRGQVVEVLRNSEESARDTEELNLLVTEIIEADEKLKKKTDEEMESLSEKIKLVRTERLNHGQIKLKLRRMSESVGENKGNYFDKKK